MAGLTAPTPARPSERAQAVLSALALPRLRVPGWVAAFFICFVPAVLVASGQPIWSRVDEAQHWDFVAHLAQGSYPVEGRTMILQSTVDLMAETGIFRWNVPGDQPLPLQREVSQFTTVPSYLHGYARRLWVQRHIWWFSYEAGQPPLYYLAAVPFWLAGNHLAGPEGAVYAVRVLDALLVGCLGLLAFLLARTVFPGRRVVAWLSAVVVAVLPGLLLNGSQVTNDTLAGVLGAATLLAAVRGLRSGWPARSVVLVGFLFGAALLTKLTTTGLALPLLAAFAWPSIRARKLVRRDLLNGCVAAGIAVIVVVPWLVLNLHLYGHVLPSAASRNLIGAIFPTVVPSPGFVLSSLRNGFATFWAGEPYREVPLHQLTTYLMAAWCAVALYTIWRIYRRDPRGFVTTAVGLALLATAGEVMWSLVTLEVSGVGGHIPGRYLFPALAAIVVLCVGGLLEVVRTQAVRAAVFGLLVAGAAVNVGGFLLGFNGYPVVHRTGPSAASSYHLVRGQGDFFGARVTVDELAADPSNGSLWFHLTVVNTSDGPIEWWPVLYVTLPGGQSQEGQYSGSTQFPDSIAAGQSTSGWAKVPIQPFQLNWPTPMQAELVDIAADGYRHLGDLQLKLLPA
ncbi:MAG TPA: hypothetical protein VF137_12385 [Candidatus Dormibacteraeota bacterium]